MKTIGDILSSYIVGKRESNCHHQIIALNATVTTGKTDHNRPRFDDREHRPIIRERSDEYRVTPVHERIHGKLSVHHQLGGKAMTSDRLEKIAIDLVPDKEQMRRDPERQPVH